MTLLEFFSQPWPWYIGGPGIALIVFLMIWAGQRFSISSSLESICTIAGAGRISDYFQVDWKSKSWMVVFVIGSMIGGYLSQTLLNDGRDLVLSSTTINALATTGLTFDGAYLPMEIFNWGNLWTLQGAILFVIGGFLIGFGTRWAGGCTSGHAISGLANLQLPSLVATIAFFIGGLITTHLLLPYILAL